MKIIDLRTLKNDIITFKKLLIKPAYIENLKRGNEIVETLRIQDEITYYKYQITLKDLKDLSYYEASFLKRIENKEYLDIIKKMANKHSLSIINKHTFEKIIEFKKR